MLRQVSTCHDRGVTDPEISRILIGHEENPCPRTVLSFTRPIRYERLGLVPLLLVTVDDELSYNHLMKAPYGEKYAHA